MRKCNKFFFNNLFFSFARRDNIMYQSDKIIILYLNQMKSIIIKSMQNQIFDQAPSSKENFNKNEADMFACFDNKNDQKNQKQIYWLMQTGLQKFLTYKKQCDQQPPTQQSSSKSSEKIQEQNQLIFWQVLKENQIQKNKNSKLQQENASLKTSLKQSQEKEEDLNKVLKKIYIRVEDLEIQNKSLEDNNSILSNLNFQIQMSAEKKISQLKEQIEKLQKIIIKREKQIKQQFKGRIKKQIEQQKKIFQLKIETLQIKRQQEEQQNKDIIVQFQQRIIQLENEPKIFFPEQNYIYEDNPQKLILEIVKFMDNFFVSGQKIRKDLSRFLHQSINHQQIYNCFLSFLFDVSQSIDIRLLLQWDEYLRSQEYQWVSNCFQKLKQSQNNLSQTKQKAQIYIPLQKVIKQTLYYVVLNMNEETIVKTINKTPAKDFTNLITAKDQLTGKPLYILKVASYSFLQKFIKIKKKIEQFFYKQGVQFVGVGQKIRIRNILMRNQAEQILRKDVALFIVQQNDAFSFGRRVLL